jgi:hypothetical protein
MTPLAEAIRAAYQLLDGRKMADRPIKEAIRSVVREAAQVAFRESQRPSYSPLIASELILAALKEVDDAG